LAFVGILEDYDKSIKRLEEVIDIKFPKKMDVLLKTPNKVEVTEEDRKYIEWINWKDRRIYNRAIRRFMK
jgi:hypothetical protein